MLPDQAHAWFTWLRRGTGDQDMPRNCVVLARLLDELFKGFHSSGTNGSMGQIADILAPSTN
jgi:hypothetical protein